MGNAHEGRNSSFEAGKSINTFNRDLEELLREPAVKDRFIANLAYMDPEKARELVKILLWSDSAFAFGMLGQLPRGFNFAIAFLDELGKQLQNIPPHLLREFAGEMMRTLDLKSIRALPHAYAPLLAALNPTDGDDPEVSRQNRERITRFLQDAIRSADFGKIRKKITRQAEYNYPVIENVVATMVSDPIIFANLINIIPPLLNNLLKGTAKTLEKIDYPPEILASAVFNLLDDLKAEELGSIINNLNILINKIHEGSAVLGQSEPRFRTTFQRFLEKALSDLDQKEAADVLTALGEDLEVIIYAVSDTVVQKPELLKEISPALLQFFSAGLRGLTYLLEQLNQMPPQNISNTTRDSDSTIFVESARLLNALVGLSNRVLEDNPAFLEKSLVIVNQSVDKEEISRLLNSGLKSYNSILSEEPVQLKGTVALYLDYLDHEELSRALLLTSGHLSETLAGNPRLSRTVLKSFFRIIGGLIRGSFKRERRTQGRQS